MKVVIPVTQDAGLDSPVSAHFGSAPLFVLVDTESREVRALHNLNVAHEHGACRPLDALAGREIDACLVGGIGGGAIRSLLGAGIRVLRAEASTVAGCLDQLVRGEAHELGVDDACQGHGGGHQHGHGTGHAPGPTVLPSRS